MAFWHQLPLEIKYQILQYVLDQGLLEDINDDNFYSWSLKSLRKKEGVDYVDRHPLCEPPADQLSFNFSGIRPLHKLCSLVAFAPELRAEVTKLLHGARDASDKKIDEIVRSMHIDFRGLRFLDAIDKLEEEGTLVDRVPLIKAHGYSMMSLAIDQIMWSQLAGCWCANKETVWLARMDRLSLRWHY